jgi:FkbM family methyltransferase
MGQARRRVFARSLLLLLLVLAVVAAASSDPRVRWRAQVVAWKVSGSLPYVSWSATFKALLPGRWRTTPPAPGDFVREKGNGQEPCPVLWDTALGSFWGQRNDNATLDDLHRFEMYQSGPVAIRSGDVVIDCGSQLGTFSRFALGRGAGLVVAFEPDPINNTCFKRTFEKEIAEGRVILVEAALWETSGTTKFVVASRSDAGGVVSAFNPRWGAVRVVDVPMTRLDDAVQRLNLPRVDFIKWAIGGATRPALRGSRQTLSRYRPRMVMLLNDSPDDPVALPPVALEAVPSYNVFTRGLEVAYFY